MDVKELWFQKIETPRRWWYGGEHSCLPKDGNLKAVLDDKKQNGQYNYMECIVLD